MASRDGRQGRAARSVAHTFAMTITSSAATARVAQTTDRWKMWSRSRIIAPLVPTTGRRSSHFSKLPLPQTGRRRGKP